MIDQPSYLKKCRICGQEFLRSTPENALTALSGHLAERHHGESAGLYTSDSSAGLYTADRIDARWLNMISFDDCEFLRAMKISPF